MYLYVEGIAKTTIMDIDRFLTISWTRPKLQSGEDFRSIVIQGTISILFCLDASIFFYVPRLKCTKHICR